MLGALGFRMASRRLWKVLWVFRKLLLVCRSNGHFCGPFWGRPAWHEGSLGVPKGKHQHQSKVRSYNAEHNAITKRHMPIMWHQQNESTKESTKSHGWLVTALQTKEKRVLQAAKVLDVVHGWTYTEASGELGVSKNKEKQMRMHTHSNVGNRIFIKSIKKVIFGLYANSSCFRIEQLLESG